MYNSFVLLKTFYQKTINLKLTMMFPRNVKHILKKHVEIRKLPPNIADTFQFLCVYKKIDG